MSLRQAIRLALEKHPGPTERAVRNWVARPTPKPRPKAEHFNIGKQTAVEKVWKLMDGGMSRLAACREVFPTVSFAAWGRGKRSLRRLYDWCDGPRGDRFGAYKVDHLEPMQLYEYENLRELGYPPAIAYKLCKEIAAGAGTTG